MTSGYIKQKNNLIFFIVTSLFIFTTTAALYIYEKEEKHIIHNEQVKLQTEIELLGEFLSDSILRRDYAQAKNYLQSWVKKADQIRKLDVSFENGFKLFSYNKDCTDEMFVKKSFQVGNKVYIIKLSHSVKQMRVHMEELAILLIYVVIFFTLLTGFILWFILSHWILKPLQEEIENKTLDLNLKQKELKKINRSYQALSNCNIALLEAKSEQELLDKVCQAIYQKSEYKLVWVGYALKNSEKNVKVMAHMGKDDEYLKDVNIYWSDCERGNGPTGRAIRERKAIVINNTQTDPCFLPWQESALERGYYSCAGIPIILGDKIFGAITLYSQKADSFLNEELALLEELASNLAFGIVSLRQRQEIEKSSITDGLTAIYNRRYFDKKLEQIIDYSSRNNDMVALLMLDVDYFKQYNDNYGHQKGDEVLKAIAGALDDATKRVNDYCFRLGGEEFGVLFLTNTKEHGLLFAKEIKSKIDALALEHKYSEVSESITVSMGLNCLYSRDIVNAQEFYKQTDELLYKAKKSGRNKVAGN